MTWVRKALKIFDVSLSNMEAEQRKTIERPCWKMTLGQKLKPISKIFNTFSSEKTTIHYHLDAVGDPSCDPRSRPRGLFGVVPCGHDRRLPGASKRTGPKDNRTKGTHMNMGIP